MKRLTMNSCTPGRLVLVMSKSSRWPITRVAVVLGVGKGKARGKVLCSTWRSEPKVWSRPSPWLPEELTAIDPTDKPRCELAAQAAADIEAHGGHVLMPVNSMEVGGAYLGPLEGHEP